MDGNVNIIAWDLVRSIIEWLPRSDLRDLSRASPIFDQEIYCMGIKMIYLKNGKYIIPENDKVIFVTKIGQLFVLKSSYIADARTIKFAENPDHQKKYLKDPETGFAMYYDRGNILLYYCDEDTCNKLQSCLSCNYTVKISCNKRAIGWIGSIDPISCMIVTCNNNDDTVFVSIHNFRVIFKNGEFV